MKRMISFLLVIAMLAGYVPALPVRAEEADVSATEQMLPAEETVPAVEETVAPQSTEGLPEEIPEEPSEESAEEPSEETTVPTEAATEPSVEPEETVSREAMEATVASGTCGTNVSWSLSGGVLTISGSGKMTSYSLGTSGVNPAKWGKYADEITKVVIQQGVTSIGAYAFAWCDNLSSVSIPSGVTTIGKYAFRNCPKLTSAAIPSGVKTIGQGAFYQCAGLSAIEIPSGVTELGSHVFQGCTSLKSAYVPTGITTMADNTFADCSSLKTLTIGSNPGQHAFQNCTALTDVVLLSGVTLIGYGAFKACTALLSIELPSTITEIASYAFLDCGMLSRIVFLGKAPTINSDAFKGVVATALYPNGDSSWTSAKRQNYGGTLSWVADGVVISFSANGGSGAPAKIMGRKAITIPMTLPTRWGYTFLGWSTSSYWAIAQYFPGNTYDFSASAMLYAAWKAAVEIPSGVTDGSYCAEIDVFGGSWMYKFTPPEDRTMTFESSGTADSCISVLNASGSQVLASDDNSGENLNFKLTYKFKVGTEYYIKISHRDTYDTGDITFTVTGAPASNIAAGNCGDTLSWTMDKNGILTVSGYGAMYRFCEWGISTDFVKEVYLPEGQTSIGDYGFAGFRKMTKITIPSTITYVGEYAFSNCQYLDEITFSGSAPEFGRDVFFVDRLRIHYPGDDPSWTQSVRGGYGGDISWIPYCKNAHTLVNTPGTNPTCTEPGLTESSYCSVCSTVFAFQTEIPPKGHTPVLDEAVAPTCTETGLTQGSHCSVCDTVLTAQKTVAAKGHTSAVMEAVAPTCTATGLTEGSRCSVCEEILVPQQVLPMVDHAPVVDAAVEQTCTETGLTEGSHCGVCGEILAPQQEIPMHFPEVDPEVPSGCTENGLTEGSHCSVCLEVLVPQEIIPAAHTPVIDPAVAASCTQTGLTEGSHCEICEEVLVPQEEVPTVPHSFSEGVCRNCGEFSFHWEVSADGTLTITGTGEIPDFSSASDTPWYDHREQITELRIAYGITAIGDRAFAELSNLRTASIPDSVTSVGDSAFRRCYALTEIDLGKNVTSIGISAFEHCEKLASITYPASANVKSDAFCNTPVLSQIILTAGAMPNFTDSNNWKLPWFESGAEKITVKMLDGVTHIGDYAFSGITSKVQVEFPASLKSIGDYAFYQAELPYQLKLPNKLKTIGDYAFSDSYNVFIVKLPDSVTELGVGVFYENVTLTYLEFPKGLNEIPAKTCEGCISLKKVFLPEFDRATETLYIGQTAFACCISLENISFPGVVVDIEREAFMLTGLKTLSLPAECKVHNYAFSYNVYLTRIDMFEDDVDLHMYAFLGCENLQTLNIDGYSAMETGRVYIAEAAFMDCYRLRQVYYHRSSAYWNVKDCFYGGVEISNYAGENNYLMSAAKYFNRTLGSVSELSVYDLSWTLTDYAPLEEQRIYPVNMNNTKDMTLAIFNHQGDGVEKYTYSTTMSVPGAVTFEDVSEAGLPGRLKMTFRKPCNLELVINYTYYDGRTFTKTLMFEIQKPVTRVTVGLREGFIPLNDTTKATASVYPSDAGNTSVSWQVINGTGSARIDQNGNVYGVKEGTVTLRATAADGSGVYGEKTVKVSRRMVQSIAIRDELSGMAGLNLPRKLTADVLPANAENRGIIWSVINGTGEGTIDQDGWFTGTKAGTVTVCATAADGSGVAHSITLSVEPYAVKIQGEDRVKETGSITLSASLYPGNLTNTQVVLELEDPADSQYVRLDGNTLTALNISEYRTVTVLGVSRDGKAETARHTVQLIPFVERMLLEENDTDITGKTLYFDLNDPEMTKICISTAAAPVGADDRVTWTNSDKTCKFAEYEMTDNGITVRNPKGKTGAVTLTAVSKENGKVKAQVKIQFVRLAQSIEIQKSRPELRAGASLKLTTSVAKEAGLTDRNVIWSLSDESEPYASIASSGTLTTRKVIAPVTITVQAHLKNNPEVKARTDIRLLPAATETVICADGVPTAKGQTIYVPMSDPVVTLTADILPQGAMQKGSWKLSSTKDALLIQKDGYMEVRMLNIGKTVTVTFKAEDGSNKSTTLKLQSVLPTDAITLTAPKNQTELRSGKSLQLKATAQTNQAGVQPTVRKYTWSVSDSTAATVSSGGVVKALPVYKNTPVTVTAEAMDGSGVRGQYELVIKPAKIQTLLLMVGQENVTGASRYFGARFDGISALPQEEITAWVYDSDADTLTAVDAVLSFSGKSLWNEDNVVSPKAYGKTTVTAKYGKLSAKVTYTVVQNVEGIQVTSRNGSNHVLAGKSLSLQATVTNKNATVKKLNWSVSDPTVATVSQSGVLKAYAVTKRTAVTVTASATDGSGVTSGIEIMICPAATSIDVMDADTGRILNNRNLTVYLKDSKTMKLSAGIFPDGAWEGVKYSVSGGAAKITQDGVLTFVKKGTATVKVTSQDTSSVYVSFKITIK